MRSTYNPLSIAVVAAAIILLGRGGLETAVAAQAETKKGGEGRDPPTCVFYGSVDEIPMDSILTFFANGDSVGASTTLEDPEHPEDSLYSVILANLSDGTLITVGVTSDPQCPLEPVIPGPIVYNNGQCYERDLKRMDDTCVPEFEDEPTTWGGIKALYREE